MPSHEIQLTPLASGCESVNDCATAGVCLAANALTELITYALKNNDPSALISGMLSDCNHPDYATALSQARRILQANP